MATRLVPSELIMPSTSPTAPSSPHCSSGWDPAPPAAAADSSSYSPPEDYPDDSDYNNAGKKPVWNMPSNGAMESGAVVDANNWPPLSESTKPSPKPSSSSSESLKALSDGSQSQVIGITTSLPPKQYTSSSVVSPSSPLNRTKPTRQKSMGRGGGGSSSPSVSANGGADSSVVELNFSGNPKPVVSESTSKETGHRESFGSQSHGGNGHGQQQFHGGNGNGGYGRSQQQSHGGNGNGQQQSHGGFGRGRNGSGQQSHGGNDHGQRGNFGNSFRRGNGGTYPRGDGSYQHNYLGRRDQDHGNHDWNSNRGINGRDAHMQQQRFGPRGLIRHPPPPPPHSAAPFIPYSAPPFIPHSSPQFIPPPVGPVRPFGGHMGYSDVAFVPGMPPDSLRAMPMVAAMPPHAMFFPVTDPQLPSKIVNQVDYYFSNENLIKDTFLRQNMDDQGWVPVKLIAGFKKVMQLTDNIQLILDALRNSTVVEVQNDRLRRRNDWMRWIMPAVQFSGMSSSSRSSSYGRSSLDMLTGSLQNVSIQDNNSWRGPSQPSTGPGTSQVGGPEQRLA